MATKMILGQKKNFWKIRVGLGSSGLGSPPPIEKQGKKMRRNFIFLESWSHFLWFPSTQTKKNIFMFLFDPPNKKKKYFLDYLTQTKIFFRFLDPTKKISLDSSTQTKKNYFIIPATQTMHFHDQISLLFSFSWLFSVGCFQVGCFQVGCFQLVDCFRQQVGRLYLSAESMVYGKWNKIVLSIRNSSLNPPQKNKNVFQYSHWPSKKKYFKM